MEVEYIIMADHADVLNNKLYVMGGGWETLTINSGFPALYPCAVAVSFLVAPPQADEPDRLFNIGVDITDEAGEKTLARVSGQVEAAWSPDRPARDAERAQIAIKLGLAIERPGRYFVKARIEGKERVLSFDVIEGPGLQEAPPPALGNGEGEDRR